MNEICIYTEPKEDDVLRLKLVQDGVSVRLVATDGCGNPLPRGYILEITRNGELHLFAGLADNLGISVDEDRAIKCV